MARRKISAHDELAEQIHPDDWLIMVDRSDLTMAATGTTKKIKASNVAPASGGSSFTEYLFAFPEIAGPVGDIGTWHYDDGTPLDTYDSGGAWTVASSTLYPGPSGYSMRIEFADTFGYGDYFATPVFAVTAGQIVEWMLSLNKDNDTSATATPVTMEMYPLYWLASDPTWATPYDSSGETESWKSPDGTITSLASVRTSPYVHRGAAIIPDGVDQAAIEFSVLTLDEDAFEINVQGCYVRITDPPTIT